MTEERLKTILIIEDEEGIRSVLQQILELNGYCAFTATNGKEGLEKLRHISRPGLILLDLLMPVMNGWDFAEAISGNNDLNTIPIVVLTAFGEKSKKVKNVQKIIKKPFDMDELLKKVSQYFK